MKVVYNVCFGGFSISKECAEYMADRGNIECIELLTNFAENKDPGRHGDEWFTGNLWDTPRHDAILVMAVENLGSEAASGDCSDLQIHELQSDRYCIEDYDGSESVIEPQSIVWVVV